MLAPVCPAACPMQVHYEERVWSKGILIILSLCTLAIAGMLTMQLVKGPVGSNPAPTPVLIGITVLLATLTFNFSAIRIKITDTGFQARYGAFVVTRRWYDIESVEEDKINKWYGGWGIRFGRYKDKKVLVYNIIGGRRIVLLGKYKKPRSLIVSTANPDEVVKIARRALKEYKKSRNF